MRARRYHGALIESRLAHCRRCLAITMQRATLTNPNRLEALRELCALTDAVFVQVRAVFVLAKLECLHIHTHNGRIEVTHTHTHTRAEAIIYQVISATQTRRCNSSATHKTTATTMQTRRPRRAPCASRAMVEADMAHTHTLVSRAVR